MPARIALALMLALAASAAESADLAAHVRGHSRLGALFAAPRLPQVMAVNDAPLVMPLLPPLKVPGYYGQPGDFRYRNYYGTSPLAIFSRLPYACGLHGYC